MPGILIDQKSLTKKINKLLQNDKLLIQFTFYLFEINYPRVSTQGEEHSSNKCNRAIHITEFILTIKEFFSDKNSSMVKKKTFLKQLV